MSNPKDVVSEFLKQWKPIAVMAPGNPVRRGVLRFMATDDVSQRETIVAKTNMLYALHRQYRELAIFREDNPPFAEDIAEVFKFSVADFATAIEDNSFKNITAAIQKAFQFGRYEADPKHVAFRKFLTYLWAMPVGGPGLKYSMYSNGVIYSAGGLTHEEMAREYNQMGFGGDKPDFGGQFYRADALSFEFDAGSTTFVKTANPSKVDESVRRWVRVTGGDAGKLQIKYLPRPGN